MLHSACTGKLYIISLCSDKGVVVSVRVFRVDVGKLNETFVDMSNTNKLDVLVT